MEENLLGYLLRALDDADQCAVEASLQASPELRERLARLERAVRPLAADAEPSEPPPGLVIATLARVAEHRCRRLPDAPPTPRSQPVTAGRSRMRRPDVLVAAVLLVVLGGVGSSYLFHLWRNHGRLQCQDNLRHIFTGLRVYCDNHNGNYPLVEEQGPRAVAGIFVPVLRDSGTLGPEESVACPSHERRPQERRSLRDMDELYQKDRSAFRQEAREQAGGYAYTLGFRDADGFHGLRCDTGDGLPIMADRLDSPAQDNSANHGGGGQNVLYLGGQVQWHTNRRAGIDGDDIYLNWDNRVLAGKAWKDTVLAPGDASPKE
jgi:hypothetical protein